MIWQDINIILQKDYISDHIQLRIHGRLTLSYCWFVAIWTHQSFFEYSN